MSDKHEHQTGLEAIWGGVQVEIESARRRRRYGRFVVRTGAALGVLADHTSITFVYHVCAFLPALGLLAFWLPNLRPHYNA